MPYKHLFFDLDHTLWDTDRNALESLHEIYNEIKLPTDNLPLFEDFYKTYKSHNEKLWGLYSENKIGKEAVRINRFRYTLEDFKIYDYKLAELFADEFIKRTPLKQHLMCDTIFVLDQLSLKYSMSIITNGFSESQQTKLSASGIQKYFDHVFISEEVGFNKPDPRIFTHALTITATSIDDAIMIGDTYETDVIGACAAGIDQVLFKQEIPDHHTATFKISKLIALLDII